jgi:hypothetical protein
MTRPLLDFDDAGAQDDHPAKGVTVGDIRAWFDEIERLRKTIVRAKDALIDGQSTQWVHDLLVAALKPKP